MKPYAIAALAFVALSAPAFAQDLFTPEEQREMKAFALEHFWGKAVDSKGATIQPKDEKERHTLPIDDADANAMLDKGGESGLAEWCSVPWEGRFHLLMEARRKAYGGNDVKTAYATVLHGLAQRRMFDGMNGEMCDASMKQQISGLIGDDVKQLQATSPGNRP